MSYLSNNNAIYIVQILQRFFKDKYQFDIYEDIPQDSLQQLVATKMNNLYQINDNKSISMETLNKMTLSELKEAIKQSFIQKPKEETPQPEPPMQLSEDSEFINKVQRLELQRKTFQVPPPQSNPPIVQTPIATQQSNINAAIPTSISTIYMPTPPKIGKEIFIHSYDREWIYENQRSSFIWSGKFPKMQDMICRVGCWIGSLKILQKAPCLILHIQGASGDIQEVSLIPSYTCHYFAVYKPPLESLGYIRLFALPWKITLKSGDGQPIDLGSDGEMYERYEAHPYLTNHTIIYINKTKQYAIEQSIRILTVNNKLYIGKIIQVNNISIEVDIAITELGYLLNFSEQFSFVLELTSGDHRPIKN